MAAKRKPKTVNADNKAATTYDKNAARDRYKFDEIKREAYLQHLRDGMRRGKASEAVGVTRALVCDYKLQYPEFAIEESKAEMEANEHIVNALFDAATVDRNVTAIQVWLYNREPENWRDRRNDKPELLEVLMDMAKRNAEKEAELQERELRLIQKEQENNEQ